MFVRLSEIPFGFLGILLCFILMSLLQIAVVDSKHTWNSYNHVVKISKESHHFLEMIFSEFGSNDTDRIEVEQFKNLLQQLRIANNKEIVKKEEKDNHDHKETHTRSLDHSEGSHVKGENPNVTEDENEKRNASEEHDIDDHIKCLGDDKLLNMFYINRKRGITESDFIQICPAMIYQIMSGICSHGSHGSSTAAEKHMMKVWGYGILSITIISLSSLLVIVVIPLIGRSVYYKLMSFLVALAVGTLSGDAMLHLIPHALQKNNHEKHTTHKDSHYQHNEAVWKSCVVMAGIFLFFIVETIMKTREGGHRHTDSDKDEAETKHETAKQNGKSFPNLRCNVGSRLAGVRSHNSCYFDNMLSEKKSNCNDLEGSSVVTFNLESEGARCNLLNHAQLNDCTAASSHNQDDKILNNSTHGDNSKKEITIKEQKALCHHGNKDISKTTSIASVAWMVIVSDGFHNFSDGLAVGAAFSNSLATGLTTAIAVFCHEIPHELGDFAILVKSGLTIKQAIAYNMASAVISYVGLILGIIIGNITSAHGWVLALTAGMFLYVSLVDMLPEMRSFVNEEAGRVATFFLQILGMLLGIVVMLFVALLESH